MASPGAKSALQRTDLAATLPSTHLRSDNCVRRPRRPDTLCLSWTPSPQLCSEPAALLNGLRPPPPPAHSESEAPQGVLSRSCPQPILVIRKRLTSIMRNLQPRLRRRPTTGTFLEGREKAGHPAREGAAASTGIRVALSPASVLTPNPRGETHRTSPAGHGMAAQRRQVILPQGCRPEGSARQQDENPRHGICEVTRAFPQTRPPAA